MILGEIDVSTRLAAPLPVPAVLARPGRDAAQIRADFSFGHVRAAAVQPVNILVEQRLRSPAHGAFEARREVLVGAILARPLRLGLSHYRYRLITPHNVLA